jgi:hypothetical protein
MGGGGSGWINHGACEGTALGRGLTEWRPVSRGDVTVFTD